MAPNDRPPPAGEVRRSLGPDRQIKPEIFRRLQIPVGERLHELAQVFCGSPGAALREDLAGLDVEGRDEGPRTVAEVLEFAADSDLPHGATYFRSNKRNCAVVRL